MLQEPFRGSGDAVGLSLGDEEMVAMVMVHQRPKVPCIGAPAGPGSL
jgi:hypothetical protein